MIFLPPATAGERQGLPTGRRRCCTRRLVRPGTSLVFSTGSFCSEHPPSPNPPLFSPKQPQPTRPEGTPLQPAAFPSRPRLLHRNVVNYSAA